MTKAAGNCAELEHRLHSEVPLSKVIGMKVHGYDGDRLELRADLRPNINIYGVAFGGSIYSMCALSGWGLLVMKLWERDLDPRIMITGGEIEYSRPVAQSIRAISTLAGEQVFTEFIAAYSERSKARIKVPVSVEIDDGSVAAQFTGSYIALEGKYPG